MKKFTEIDLPIGTMFIVSNDQLEVTEQNLCVNCYYQSNYKACQLNNLHCSDFARIDQKNVIFKQIGTVNQNEKPWE